MAPVAGKLHRKLAETMHGVDADWHQIGKSLVHIESQKRIQQYILRGSKKLIVGLYLRRSCSNCSSIKDRNHLHALAHYEKNLIWFSGSARYENQHRETLTSVDRYQQKV